MRLKCCSSQEGRQKKRTRLTTRFDGSDLVFVRSFIFWNTTDADSTLAGGMRTDFWMEAGDRWKIVPEAYET